MVRESSFEAFAVVPMMTSAFPPPIWAWQDPQREKAASLFTQAMALTVLHSQGAMLLLLLMMMEGFLHEHHQGAAILMSFPII